MSNKRTFSDGIIEKLQVLFERYHKFIQFFFFLIFIILEVFVGGIKEPTTMHVIILLIYIMAELFAIVTHMTIIQQKINIIKAVTAMEKGQLFCINEDFKNIDSLFTDTEESVFLSGMTMSGLLEAHRSQISDLVNSGKKVSIMFGGIDAIKANCAISRGKSDGEAMNYYITKLSNAFAEIKLIENVDEHIKDGNLKIGFYNSPMTFSVIGTDLFSKSTSNVKLKILFYVNEIKSTSEEPNYYAKISAEQAIFKNSCKLAWEKSEKINSVEDLNFLEEYARALSKSK